MQTFPMSHSLSRSPVIGVMGSHAAAHVDKALEVGRWIAESGFHLLTGGGGGVMESVSQAFCQVTDRRGMSLAVIPSVVSDRIATPEEGYPNPWVDIPIYTHLDRGVHSGDEPTSRNHINVLSSTVVILLPGGEGTASEARLAMRYRKPCIAYLKSKDELPGCPQAVRVASRFKFVAEFVLANVTPCLSE